MKIKAFTLIELLVVIAIIAILAAILFPVFAQAKSAAKNIAVVSNLKQISTANMMYLADYDDKFQMAGTMNGNGASWGTGACSVDTFGCPNWATIMYPYMKNIELFESSFDQTAPVFTGDGDTKFSFRAAGNVIRGWAGVNTWDGQDYGWATTSHTSIPSVASTILYTEQRMGLSNSGCTWWEGAPLWECSVWDSRSNNTVSNEEEIVWNGSTDPQTQYVSGVDYAYADKANFVFADGHVASRPRGYIFEGYEQRLNMASEIDPDLPGVCLEADPFSTNENDCPLPGQN